MEFTVNDTSFKKEILESDIPVLVDFWAPWCGPCRMVTPIVEEIAKEYAGKLKVCKVNVDESPQSASGYGVMSIPTLAIFKNGELVNKTIGAVPKDELESVIKTYI
jgi:thioredoxin 1